MNGEHEYRVFDYSKPRLFSTITHDELENYKQEGEDFVRFVIDLEKTDEVSFGGKQHTDARGLFPKEHAKDICGGVIFFDRDGKTYTINFLAAVNMDLERRSIMSIENEELKSHIIKTLQDVIK